MPGWTRKEERDREKDKDGIRRDERIEESRRTKQNQSHEALITHTANTQPYTHTYTRIHTNTHQVYKIVILF